MKTNPNTKPLWDTCYQWLRQCGIEVHKSYCREEISTHPDYPALTSVVDFLESGGMRYYAVRADASYIQEFTYPVLAHIQLSGQEYMHLVPDARYWEKQSEITQHWSGIVVIPAEETAWSTSENTAYLRSELKKRTAVVALCLVGLAVFATTVYLAPNFLLNTFGLLSLVGILVSVLLQANELGFQSQIIKQVCGAFSESGCERVLKSSYGKGIWGLTPADVSLLYFATQFILYVVSCLGNPLFSSGLLMLALVGTVVMGWSLYTQAVKLKVWCALCLIVVAVLGGQALVAFLLGGWLVSPVSGEAFGLLAVGLSLIFLPVKDLLKTNMTNKLKLAELKKWKSDGALFASQWQQEQAIDNRQWPHDLILGSAEAPLCITVACNPYCSPCAKTHRELDNLLARYSEKVCVQLRLLAPSPDANDRLIQAVRAILQKAAEGLPPATLQAMLTSWFEKMNLQQWTQQWQPDTTLDVQERLEQHRSWMEQSQIVYTPTLFLNGRKIPGRYSLEDIEHLIPQLTALLPSASRDVAVLQ